MYNSFKFLYLIYQDLKIDKLAALVEGIIVSLLFYTKNMRISHDYNILTQATQAINKISYRQMGTLCNREKQTLLVESIL